MKNVVERLLNLLAFLLTVGRPVTAEEIRHTVAGYAQESDEAFHRMFERDKELLRSMGIPLERRPVDAWEVESGYVVPPDEYRMPDPGLSDEERTALWLAAQVVRLGGQPSGPEAVFKLGGARMTAGVEPLAADLGAEAGILGELFNAVVERRDVTFEYRGKTRKVRPYGLGHRRGHWYLVGEERGEERMFRVDRASRLRVGDTPGAFARPRGFRLREVLDTAPWEAGGDDETLAVVRFDPEVAWWAARRLEGSSAASPLPDGGLEVTLRVSNVEAFLSWVLAFGAQAEVVAPVELRDRIIQRVQGVA
jgi:predicted DNA-binding transcriptional regulator YafY